MSMVDIIVDYYLRWPLRFVSQGHAMAWFYIVSSFVITLIFLRFRYSKKWMNSLSQIFKQPLFLKELSFDLKNYGFKLIFEPLFIILVGYNIVEVDRVSLNGFVQFFASSLSPQFLLDNLFGSFFASLAIFFAWDFSSFISHYIQHKIEPLWIFHHYHHRAESLNPLTKYRVHPVDLFVYNGLRGLTVGVLFVMASSLFVKGRHLDLVPVTLVAYFLHFPLIHLRHSPIQLNYWRWLSYILISPSMHQVHHSQLEKHKHKNFGVIFSFWDFLFGTLYIPQKDEKLFIQGDNSKQQRRVLTEELARPFRDFMKWLRGHEKLTNQKGLSLVELMITSALFGGVILIAGYLFTNFMSMSQKMRQNTSTTEQFYQAAYLAKESTFHAVDVRFAGNRDLQRTGSNAGEGYVRSFRYRGFADLPGNQAVTPLMYFALERQASVNNPAGIRSNLRTFALFFQEPTREESGKLIFVYGPTGTQVLTPSGRGNFHRVELEGFVGVELENELSSPNGVLQSIDLVLTSRRFTSVGDNLSPKLWCPTLEAATQCPGAHAFKDIQQRVKLNFANNKQDTDRTSFEFSFGAYFFKRQL